MGLDELLSGRELIVKHNNSIKDLPSKGLKEYCPNNSWLEGKQIQVQLEERYNFIKAERIEKSNSVAQAEWVPHLQKAKLTKHFGKLWETLGHHQDNEDWLLPEEALFLIENSELQLFYNDVSLSVEDCYELVFNEGGCSFDEYKVFSYLCRAGYRVIRHSSSVRVTHYEKQVRLDAIVQSQKRDAPDGKEMALVSASEKSNLPIVAESRSESPEVEIIDGPSSVTPKAERSQPVKAGKTGVPEETIVLIESDDDDDNNIEIKEISDSDSDSDVVCISSPSYNSPNSNSRGWYPKLDKCLRRTLEQVVDLCDDDHDNEKCNIRNRMDLIRASKSEILARLPSVDNVETSFVVADRMLLPPNSVPKFSEYKTRVNIKTDDSRYQNDFNDRRVGIYERPQYNGTLNGFDNYNNFQQNQAAPLGVGEYGNNFNDGAVNGVVNFNNFLQNPLLAKAQQMQAMAMNMIQTANRLMTVMSTANNNPNELWDLLGSGGNAVARFGHRPGPTFMHHHPRFSGHQRRPYRHYRPYRRRPWGQRRPYHNAHSDNYAAQPPSDNIKPESNENDVVVLSDGDDAVEIMENDNEVKPLAKRKNIIIEAGEKRCKIDPDLDGGSETSSCIMLTPVENCKKESEEDDRVIKKEIKPVIKNENENNQSTSQLPISDNTSAIISIKSESENSRDSNAFSQTNELSSCQSPVHEKSKTQNVITPNKKEDTPVEMAKTCDSHTSSPNCDLMEVEQMDVSVELNNEPCCSKSAGKEVETPESKTQEEPTQVPNEQPEGISSWEQYKNTDNDQDLDDSLIRLDGYVSYGNILSSLKIFNRIEAKTQRNNFKISFDVYLPDSHFKKSLKVLPNYRVIILKPKDDLPTSVDIEGLKISYQDGIPFLFTVVYSETISFYMYDSVSLNTLCD